VRREREVQGLVVIGAMLVVGAVWATAPVGRYTVAADTVKDEVTGLIWQRAVPASWYTWAEAGVYCQNLSLGGMSDWRLPTKKELESIVDRRATDPAIDSAVFPNTPSEFFWSSTLYAGNSSYKWYVSFPAGRSFVDIVQGAYRVRCVR